MVVRKLVRASLEHPRGSHDVVTLHGCATARSPASLLRPYAVAALSGRFRHVRPIGVAGEDVIRRQVNEQRAGLRACAGDMPRAKRVDTKRTFLIGFCGIDGRVCRGVDDDCWSHGSDDIENGRPIGDVEIFAAECDDIVIEHAANARPSCPSAPVINHRLIA